MLNRVGIAPRSPLQRGAMSTRLNERSYDWMPRPSFYLTQRLMPIFAESSKIPATLPNTSLTGHNLPLQSSTFAMRYNLTMVAMWSSRLFWKLFLVYGGLNFALAATFPMVLSQWQESLLIDQVRNRLNGMAVVMRSQVEQDLASANYRRLGELSRRLADEAKVRITLVAADGTVIADSDENVERMQNHSNRVELIEAATTGNGSSIRRSPTLGIRMLYAAVPVQVEGQAIAFVRLAVDLESIDRQVQQRQLKLWLFTFAIALMAAPITYLIVRSIARPLMELTASARAIRGGDYKRSVPLKSRGELGELATAFDQMRIDLADRVEQLEHNNEQMSTVFSGMVEGVLAVDSQRRVLLANPACRTLLGITAKNVAGRTLLEIIRNTDIDAAVTEALAKHEPHKREIALIGPPRRVVSVLSAPLVAGTTRGAVVVLHDITELRRLENLRREFVANVSHELKTPLASIKAYAETLRMGAINDPDNNMGFVERISEQAELLNQLIMDLLHLARVEAGQEAFDITSVDIEPIITSCVGQVSQLATQKNIAVNVLPPSETVRVWADADGVLTIVSNLLRNAVNYTLQEGEVSIQWHRDGSEVVIVVQDNGIGIAEEEQDRIFERFYRVHKARSREYGGTGLGLAIVKHLTQSFGGSVSLSSELAEGSRFSVTLPVAED